MGPSASQTTGQSYWSKPPVKPARRMHLFEPLAILSPFRWRPLALPLHVLPALFRQSPVKPNGQTCWSNLLVKPTGQTYWAGGGVSGTNGELRAM